MGQWRKSKFKVYRGAILRKKQYKERSEQMFTEKELKNLLKQKEKEHRELEYKRADRIDKLRTIKINLIRQILREEQ